jgi:hypothetical protein
VQLDDRGTQLPAERVALELEGCRFPADPDRECGEDGEAEERTRQR